MGSNYIGAGSHSSGTAEWSAIIWSLMWILQLRPKVPVIIHADAVVQAWAATGKQQWRTEPIPQLSRGLTLLASYTSHVSLEHVKGHSGDALNELADYFAERFSGGEVTWPSPPPRCHQQIIDDPQARHWLWLVECSRSDLHAWPQHSDGSMHVPSHYFSSLVASSS